MSSTFVITGMPRSGTAWLSAFLTYRTCVCWHELFAERCDVGASVCELESSSELSGGAWGTADSGAVHFLDRVRAAMPNARWVIVTRDPAACRASAQRAYGVDAPFEAHAEAVDRAMSTLGASALVVPFDSVFERADEIARYCDPRWVEWPRRTAAFRKLNIQLTRTALITGAEHTTSRGSTWYS